MARQYGQEKIDLSTRLTVLEFKLDNKPVNEITNPLYIPSNQEQRQQVHYTPFEMYIPPLTVSIPWGGSIR